MTKRKKKFAKCPSCQFEKHRTEMTTCLSILESLERKKHKRYKELKIDTYASFIDSSFEWACDECLKFNRATLANPELQNYCWNPHIAYFDSKFNCNKCGKEFTFSKEEKKLWYESLGFWIDSKPNNCLACRKGIRQLKTENKTLSEILKKDEATISIEELESVISIYRKWGNDNKEKYYESVRKKRMKAKSVQSGK